MNVGVLALQGAFAEMEAYWRARGAEVFEIRQAADRPVIRFRQIFFDQVLPDFGDVLP